MGAAMLDVVQYVHLEKLYGHLPGLQLHLPAIFGLDAQEYETARRGFDEDARHAAQELLDGPGGAEIERLVEDLPFAPGQRVMAVGDSLTDDLRSWAEILRHQLTIVRPHDRVEVVNAGLSAHTTAMVLRRWPAMLGAAPDWVICALGGNDVTRVGPRATKTQVSLEESMANLQELRRIARERCDPSWLWLTPAPVVPERVAAFPGFQIGQSTWDNTDIAALAAAMRSSMSDPVVDLVETFGVPVRDGLQGPDGVHPTLLGQQRIVRAVLHALAAPHR